MREVQIDGVKIASVDDVDAEAILALLEDADMVLVSTLATKDSNLEPYDPEVQETWRQPKNSGDLQLSFKWGVR